MRFIEEQIREHEKRLAESEARLADFKKRNVGLMPSAAGGYYERLQGAIERLDALEAELRLTRRTRTELLRQIEGEVPVFGLGASAAVGGTEHDDKIANLEERLADLSLQYTDKHPDIIALKETLAGLYEQRDAELAAAGPRVPIGAEQNPVYQNMKIELAGAEVQIARLETQIGEQRAEIERLRRSVDTIPEVEAELSRLNRDYTVTRARYETLLERLETARLTENAGESSEDIRFRVIDPPTVPLDPVGPNRILFLSVTLVVSMLIGAAFAFLLSQVNPVFGSRHELRDVTGLNVLGSLSIALAPAQKVARRVQLAVFFVAIGMLLVAFTGAVALRGPATEFAEQLRMELLA